MWAVTLLPVSSRVPPRFSLLMDASNAPRAAAAADLSMALFEGRISACCDDIAFFHVYKAHGKHDDAQCIWVAPSTRAIIAYSRPPSAYDVRLLLRATIPRRRSHHPIISISNTQPLPTLTSLRRLPPRRLGGCACSCVSFVRLFVSAFAFVGFRLGSGDSL